MVAIIIREEMAPEIRPKVRIVFFIGFSGQVNCSCRRTLARKAWELSSYFWVILRFGAKNHTFRRAVHGMRRSSLPTWTAWVRRFAPSLSKIRLEWVFTVDR